MPSFSCQRRLTKACCQGRFALSVLDWNGYWDGGLNDEEHTSSSRPGLVAEIEERQHGALVARRSLLEAGGKPADERVARRPAESLGSAA